MRVNLINDVNVITTVTPPALIKRLPRMYSTSQKNISHQ